MRSAKPISGFETGVMWCFAGRSVLRPPANDGSAESERGRSSDFRFDIDAAATAEWRDRARGPSERNQQRTRKLKGIRIRWIGVALAAVCAGCTPPADEPPAAANTAPASDGPSTAGWLEHADAQRGISFRHPPDFGTQYIHALDWPPMLQVIEGPLECTEAGEETARAGRTELETIGGRRYCVTRVTEGAAGSIYTSYAYAFEMDGGVAILTFSARAVQCANYDEPQKTECESERAAFDPGAIIDAVALTLERRG